MLTEKIKKVPSPFGEGEQPQCFENFLQFANDIKALLAVDNVAKDVRPRVRPAWGRGHRAAHRTDCGRSLLRWQLVATDRHCNAALPDVHATLPAVELCCRCVRP